MEWYDPEAITTEGGSLVITLSQKETHDLQYEGGKFIPPLAFVQQTWKSETHGPLNLTGLLSTWYVVSCVITSYK